MYNAPLSFFDRSLNVTAFASLIACIVLGFLAARVNPPANLAASLNWWVLYVALPALVLQLIPNLTLHIDMWFLAAAMWLMFGLSWALFAVLGKILNWSKSRIGALTLVCGIGNTSFIGYPMIEAFRGHDSLGLAMVADQVGCFMMLAIGGAFVTAAYSGAAVNARGIARRVFLFPPFLALTLGLVVGALGGWHTVIDSILGRLGATLVPIALFSVGLQIRFQFARDQLGAASLGLVYKLALAPLIIYGVGLACGIEGPTLTIATLQAAMAPSVSAAVLAEQHGLEPTLANLTLVLGVALSFASVTIVNSWL